MESSFFSTDKGKSLIKLVLWIIFIVILVLFFRSSGSKSESTSDINKSDEIVYTFKEYAIMQNELLTLGYTYNYELSDNITYKGVFCNNIDNGYKETEKEIIKYQKEGDITYKVLMNSREEINDLYLEEDKMYLDLNNLFEDLKSYMYTTEKLDDKRIITYKKEGYQVIVNTSLDSITSMKITNNDKIYNLEFTNVGKCDNIE